MYRTLATQRLCGKLETKKCVRLPLFFTFTEKQYQSTGRGRVKKTRADVTIDLKTSEPLINDLMYALSENVSSIRNGSEWENVEFEAGADEEREEEEGDSLNVSS